MTAGVSMEPTRGQCTRMTAMRLTGGALAAFLLGGAAACSTYDGAGVRSLGSLDKAYGLQPRPIHNRVKGIKSEVVETKAGIKKAKDQMVKSAKKRDEAKKKYEASPEWKAYEGHRQAAFANRNTKDHKKQKGLVAARDEAQYAFYESDAKKDYDEWYRQKGKLIEYKGEVTMGEKRVENLLRKAAQEFEAGSKHQGKLRRRQSVSRGHIAPLKDEEVRKRIFRLRDLRDELAKELKALDKAAKKMGDKAGPGYEQDRREKEKLFAKYGEKLEYYNNYHDHEVYKSYYRRHGQNSGRNERGRKTAK